VFLLHQASKSSDAPLVHTSTFFEGEAPQIRISEKDVELVSQIVTKQIDGNSFIVCCPIHDSLVNESMGDSEVMGVMAVQIPTSCQRMSDAEVDAIKVVCQHLAEALKNSSALVRASKDKVNKQQYAAIEFLGNCIDCPDVNSMMTSMCRELHAFIQFDCAAVFCARIRKPESHAALGIEREWVMSHFLEDNNRLSAQLGILRILGTEVLTNMSSIGPLVVEGPESAENMFAHYKLAKVAHSTEISVRSTHLPKTWTRHPLTGSTFGVPLSVLQGDGSLHVCGSVVLVRDGYESKLCSFEQSHVQM
jgi:hypothetical protein